MKRSLAYISAAWRGDPAVDMEQAAHYCRVVYDAGYGDVTIPFVDRFPRGEIYNLLTTRPEDLKNEAKTE